MLNELKPEEIKGVAVLKDLTEDQLKAVVNLSKTVVDRTTKSNWDDLDREVKEATGKEKPAGTKSLSFVKGLFKTTAEDVKKEFEEKLSTLETEKAELTKKLNASGGKELETKISDLEQDLRDKDNEITSLKKTHETKLKEVSDQLEGEQTANMNLAIEQDLASGLADVKFKAGLTGDIVKDIIGARRSAALSGLKPEFVGEGKDRKIQFRDDKNDIVRDPDNNNEPATAFGLVSKKLTDLIDEGRKQKGAGGKGDKGEGGKGGYDYQGNGLDMNGVETQLDANTRIVKYLAEEEGLTKTDPKFAERQTEIYKEHEIGQLPIR